MEVRVATLRRPLSERTQERLQEKLETLNESRTANTQDYRATSELVVRPERKRAK